MDVLSICIAVGAGGFLLGLLVSYVSGTQQLDSIVVRVVYLVSIGGGTFTVTLATLCRKYLHKPLDSSIDGAFLLLFAVIALSIAVTACGLGLFAESTGEDATKPVHQ
jgi:hypothetical protein